MTRHKSQEMAEGRRNTEGKEKEKGITKGLTDDDQGRERMEDSPESGRGTPEVAEKWKYECARRVVMQNAQGEEKMANGVG